MLLPRHIGLLYMVGAGTGASWATLGATLPALVVDIVPSEKRGWALGVYERTWSVGWIVGPLIGGFLAEIIGFRLTFVLGALLMGIGILYYALRST